MDNKKYEIISRNYDPQSYRNSDHDEKGNILEDDYSKNTYKSNTYKAQSILNKKPNNNSFIFILFIGFIFCVVGGFLFFQNEKGEQKPKPAQDNPDIKSEDNLKRPKINGGGVVKFSIKDQEELKKMILAEREKVKNDNSGFDLKNINKRYIDGSRNIDNKTKINEQKLRDFRDKFVKNKEEKKSKFEKDYVPFKPREATGPRKDIGNYFHLSEDELIKEVNDSHETDYDYYIRGTKYNRGQVKATLTTITYQENYLRLLEVLLEKGFATKFLGVNEDFDVLSMAYSAAVSNKMDYFDILVKHGADLKQEQFDGMTLLHAAALNGNIDLAKRVLEAGVSIDKKTKAGKTPLYYAVRNGHYDMVVFLVEKGAVIEDDFIDLANDRNILSYLEEKGNKKVSKDNSNAFPENEKWKDAYLYIKNDEINSLKILENTGIDLSQINYDGEPASCIAIRCESSEVFEYITGKYNCNNLVDSINGRNCLHYAVMCCQPEMLKYLLRKDYNPNIKDKLGNTPLHYAAENHYDAYSKYLLLYRADPSILNEKKRNPLFYAVNSENIFLFKTLIDKGADINQQDTEGNTPLMYAVSKNLEKSVEKLLQLGADKDIPNNSQQTPMQLATLNSNTNIINLLEKYKYRVARIEIHDKKVWDKNLEEHFSEITKNLFLTDKLRLNCDNLLDFRETLLTMPENDLIELYATISSFNKKTFSYKSRENRVFLDLMTLVFFKLSIDKDFSDLFKRIVDDKFSYFTWKINYVPVVFYLADKDSKKCLDIFMEKTPIYKTELSYRQGRAYDIYQNNRGKGGKMLYLLRRLSTKDNFSRWNEIILNLDEEVFEKIDDDDEIAFQIDVGRTLLHSAAKNGNISLATKVIEAGVSIDKETQKGNTPLYYAVCNNQYEMAEFLIKHGAKVDKKSKSVVSDSKMLAIINYKDN